MKHKFKTTNIKGKEYVQVHERIKFFRAADEYKGWSIRTTLEFPEGGWEEVVCSAHIFDSQQVLRAVGHAHETKGAGNINRTSHIENCETSAVGRALGFLGIGIETSIATSEEVANALAQQDEPPIPPRAAKGFANLEEALAAADLVESRGEDRLLHAWLQKVHDSKFQGYDKKTLNERATELDERIAVKNTE